MLPVLSLCIRNYLRIGQFTLLSGIEQFIVFSLLVLFNREQVPSLLISEQDTKAFKLEKFRQYFPAVEKVIHETALRWNDRRHSYRGDNFFLSSLLDNERADLVQLGLDYVGDYLQEYFVKISESGGIFRTASIWSQELQIKTQCAISVHNWIGKVFNCSALFDSFFESLELRINSISILKTDDINKFTIKGGVLHHELEIGKFAALDQIRRENEDVDCGARDQQGDLLDDDWEEPGKFLDRCQVYNGGSKLLEAL